MISGCIRGRKLSTLPGSAVRPTADRVKEAMFSILTDRPVEAHVLDLFAGSGALGIEAISRGASSAVFVDRDRNVINVLRQNLERCNIDDRATVIQWDIVRNLNCLKAIPQAFNLVFMDPPYGLELVQKAIGHLIHIDCLENGAIIVAEHEPGAEIKFDATFITVSDTRQYGRNQLSFFRYRR